MALSAELGNLGHTPDVPDSDFEQAAEAAKQGCPVSLALAAVESIELDAELTGG